MHTALCFFGCRVLQVKKYLKHSVFEMFTWIRSQFKMPFQQSIFKLSRNLASAIRCAIFWLSSLVTQETHKIYNFLIICWLNFQNNLFFYFFAWKFMLIQVYYYFFHFCFSPELEWSCRFFFFICLVLIATGNPNGNIVVSHLGALW